MHGDGSAGREGMAGAAADAERVGGERQHAQIAGAMVRRQFGNDKVELALAKRTQQRVVETTLNPHLDARIVRQGSAKSRRADGGAARPGRPRP